MPTKGGIKVQLDEARALVESLKQELSRITKEKDELDVKLEEVTDKLGLTEEQVKELCATAEAWESATKDVGEFEDQLAEACWQLEESERTSELMVMRVGEDTRERMLCTYERELESWDSLIQLLKEKVGCLQQQLERNPATSSSEDLTREAQDNDHVIVHPVFDVPHDTQHQPTTIKLNETLTKFSSEDNEDEGAFPRWLRKLERVTGLYKWSDGEKLVQFELLLTGRAVKLHELLSAVDHESFKSATEALQKRLTSTGREALRSAQLMMRRQQTNESVNEFTQDF